MRLIAIGRMRAGPEAALFARYTARIRPRLEVLELPEARGSAAEIKRREAATLLAAVPAGAQVVALDQGGVQHGSEAFSVVLQAWLEAARPLCFVIGGAEGLDATTMERADHLLSLGAMTWPHLLARVMLAEQIFRARAIAAGHPYHRASRPDVQSRK
jgi:23S rRNA (pseudouridine1915-N3)-methyltransferase